MRSALIVAVASTSEYVRIVVMIKKESAAKVVYQFTWKVSHIRCKFRIIVLRVFGVHANDLIASFGIDSRVNSSTGRGGYHVVCFKSNL